MNYTWTFGDLQKLYFFFRGEEQNGSITGVNSDERERCREFLNEEQRFLASFRPPYLQNQWHIRPVTAVTLQSSGLNSVTGSKNRPRLIDSGANLTSKNKYWTIRDGPSRYTMIDVTGTTYQVDHALLAEATTNSSFLAYKNHYPLPHNLGDIHNIFYEDGEQEIALLPRATFQQLAKRGEDEAKPRECSVGIFTNRFADYQKQETSVTVATSSRLVTVSDASLYDMGDVLLFSNKYLHTCAGISTTTNQLWLDRNYSGTTTFVTMTQNQRSTTEYVSFHRMPNTQKDIIINGYVKPQDMVADTDKPIFPDTIVKALVVGALRRDKLGREFLTEQWNSYYDQVLRELKSKKNAKVYDDDAGRGSNPWDRTGSEYSGWASSMGL